MSFGSILVFAFIGTSCFLGSGVLATPYQGQVPNEGYENQPEHQPSTSDQQWNYYLYDRAIQQYPNMYATDSKYYYPYPYQYDDSTYDDEEEVSLNTVYKRLASLKNYHSIKPPCFGSSVAY